MPGGRNSSEVDPITTTATLTIARLTSGLFLLRWGFPVGGGFVHARKAELGVIGRAVGFARWGNNPGDQSMSQDLERRVSVLEERADYLEQSIRLLQEALAMTEEPTEEERAAHEADLLAELDRA